jgi:hypothetical protein
MPETKDYPNLPDRIFSTLKRERHGQLLDDRDQHALTAP